jgi:hypothetical protein
VYPLERDGEQNVMLKIKLTYFLYGAIVITSFALVTIGLLILSVFQYMPNIAIVRHYGPFYDHLILLVLLPMPWAALIGFSWLSHTLRRRGQSEGAWSIIFLSLRVCPETSRGITKFSEHEAD